MLALTWFLSTASAVGFGSTAALGTPGLFGGEDFFGLGGRGFAPSLDIHANPVLVQIHVLEFTEALIDADDIALGADVLFSAYEAPLSGAWLGVVEPGFGLDIYSAGDTAVTITGECRLGAQVQESAAIGLYVVPEMGITVFDGDTDWVAGGSLQVSVWFGG